VIDAASACRASRSRSIFISDVLSQIIIDPFGPATDRSLLVRWSPRSAYHLCHQAASLAIGLDCCADEDCVRVDALPGRDTNSQQSTVGVIF
jgi:hypothetical protein